MKRIKKDIKRNNNFIDDKVEENKYILSLINDFIKAADSKVSVYFGASSVLVAILIFVIGELSKNTNYCVCRTCNTILFISNICILLSIGFYIISITFNFIAISPNHFCSNKDYKYSIFYEEIKTFNNLQSFIETTQRSSKEDFNTELESEIYYNSCVCSKKMERFKKGLWMSYVSLMFVILSIMLKLFVIV